MDGVSKVQNVLLDQAHECLAQILSFYASDGGLLVDVSYGAGRLVSVLPPCWQIVGLDLAGSPAPIVRADWGRLPLRNGVADALLFDPPYITGPAKNRGRGAKGQRDAWSEHQVVLPNADYSCPVKEGARVLRSGGLFIAKIRNSREKGRMIEHDRLLRTALELCDLRLEEMFVYLKGPGSWTFKNIAHQSYGFFLVARKP